MTTFGFNLEDAKRIGRAVRLVERAEPRQDLAGEPNGAVSRGVRLLLGQHAASSWPMSSSAVVTVFNGTPGEIESAITLVAHNQFLKISTHEQCTTRWVALGNNGFGWYAVNYVNACSATCSISIGGVDFSDLPNFVKTATQMLGHDSGGCIKWFDVTTCSTSTAA